MEEGEKGVKDDSWVRLWSNWVNTNDNSGLGKVVDLRLKLIEFWTLF